MRRSLHRIAQTALWEWSGAIRSRRALVLLLLYLASAVLCMNGTISILGKMEKELAAMHDSEMWRTAETVRRLRPENN